MIAKSRKTYALFGGLHGLPYALSELDECLSDVNGSLSLVSVDDQVELSELDSRAGQFATVEDVDKQLGVPLDELLLKYVHIDTLMDVLLVVATRGRQKQRLTHHLYHVCPYLLFLRLLCRKVLQQRTVYL
jgi:hypothetical protein